MAKFVTRTTKSTEALVLVCNTEKASVEKRICFISGTYKDYDRSGDGFKAIQECGIWENNEVVVDVISTSVRCEKRRMTLADWLAHSEPCNDDEPEEDEE